MQRRAAPVRQVAHQPLLGLGVERRRRLVEQEDLRILEQRARQSESLSLPRREARAPLAELRLVAGGERAMNSSAQAMRAAARTSASLAVGRA